MMKQMILSAVLLLGVGAYCAENETAVLKAIATRTSIRQYQDKPVEKAVIEKLLRAAMAAPTAINRQPWEFVVITDAATRQAIGNKYRNAAMIKKAPLAILICGNKERFISGEGEGFWIQDISAATENLLLAAHACGLGAVWCGVYPISAKVEGTRELLHLPANVVPGALVVIGYPKAPGKPKDKWKPERVHWEKY